MPPRYGDARNTTMKGNTAITWYRSYIAEKNTTIDGRVFWQKREIFDDLFPSCIQLYGEKIIINIENQFNPFLMNPSTKEYNHDMMYKISDPPCHI